MPVHVCGEEKLKGAYNKDRVKIRVCCDGTSGNGFKLKEGGLRLGLRKNFFYYENGKNPGTGRSERL